MTTTDSVSTPAEPVGPRQPAGVGRRTVLLTGLAGATGVALAACSSSATKPPTPITASGTGSTKPTGSNAPTPRGPVIAKVSDIPVGGAAIVNAQGTSFLVAQPTGGAVVCHSGICTHQGCTLGSVQGEQALCFCHGSRFNIFTGDVDQGPATIPLGKESVTVSGNNISLG